MGSVGRVLGRGCGALCWPSGKSRDGVGVTASRRLSSGTRRRPLKVKVLAVLEVLGLRLEVPGLKLNKIK